MHDGGQRDLADLVRGQAVPQRGIGQKKFRDVVDAVDVLAGLAVAELDGRRQRLDHTHVQIHDLLGLFQQLRLLDLHHMAQPAPGLVEFDHRLHPPQHHIRDHRFADDVYHAQLVGFLHHAAAGLRGDQKHRQAAQHVGLFQMPQHLDAVHLRHHHVQQHRAQFLRPGQDHLQPLFAVCGLLNGVMGRKNISQDTSVHLVIIHHQKGGGHSGCEIRV